MEKLSFVYIVGNKKDGVLYIGVTSDFVKRIYEHKNGIYRGFTHKFNCKNLYYYEVFEDIEEAIKREKNMKSWKREWKISLINKCNAKWKDLYFDLMEGYV